MPGIKGIDIILYERYQTGKDNFNNPIYEYRTGEVIHDVLVAPTTADDVINTQDLEGKKMVYTLAIPKGDTHNWEKCKVEFFGKTWVQFGYPTQGIEENIPLRWNKKVTVECYG